MTPLFLIPARGGSKGIPHKNIVPLEGRPLIAYTVDAAFAASERIGGTVLLSTDSEDIAAAAAECGLVCGYRRPACLATDTAGSREVILDAMNWARAAGIAFDVVVLLQPTSPLRTADDIIGTLDAYAGRPDTDMAVSVCVSEDNPYYNLFEADSAGVLHICKGPGLYTRRQDVPPVFRYNGAVYAIRPESIEAMALGEFPVRVPYIMPAERSIDIDCFADLEAAGAILSRRRQ